MLHPNAVLGYSDMRLYLEGKREGKVDIIVRLCQEELIDMETGAERLNMKLDDFLYLYKLRQPKQEKAEEDEKDGEE